MSTQLVMTTSAIFLAIPGILFSFLPHETAHYLHIESNTIITLILQMLGALYMGFATLNWMVKGSLIGGIYNRPIILANLLHFGIGAITLLKIAFKVAAISNITIPLSLVYMIFAVLFVYIFKTSPIKERG